MVLAIITSNMIYDIRSPHFLRFLSTRFRVKKTDITKDTVDQMMDRIQTKVQKPMGPSGSV